MRICVSFFFLFLFFFCTKTKLCTYRLFSPGGGIEKVEKKTEKKKRKKKKKMFHAKYRKRKQCCKMFPVFALGVLVASGVALNRLSDTTELVGTASTLRRQRPPPPPDNATAATAPTAAYPVAEPSSSAEVGIQQARGRPWISIVQVDTRDPNSAAYDGSQEVILSARYNQHICTQKGWEYTFVHVKDLCPRQRGELCDVARPRSKFGPTWLKVLALWYLAEKEAASSASAELYGSVAMHDRAKALDAGRTLLVFVDSDVVLTEKSNFVPEAVVTGATHTPEEPDGRGAHNSSQWVGSHMWVGRDIGFYGERCGPNRLMDLPYRACITTGLMALYATAETTRLLRIWWDALSWNGTTPWSSYHQPLGQARSLRTDWPHEQDSLSIMLSYPPLPISVFTHTIYTRFPHMAPHPNPGFPISHAYHTGRHSSQDKIAELITFIVANTLESSLHSSSEKKNSTTRFAVQNLPPVQHGNILKLTRHALLDNMLNRSELTQASSVTCNEYKVMRGPSINTCGLWKLPVIDWNKWRVGEEVSELSSFGLLSSEKNNSSSVAAVVGCHDTCYGKAAGVYTIGGVSNVYCQDNKALISVFINTRYGWPADAFAANNYIESAKISPDRPGWRPWSGDVERLAHLSTHVILHNVDRGTLLSIDNRAAKALQLQNGTWHSQEPMFQQIRVGEGGQVDRSCFTRKTCSRSKVATGWPSMYEGCGDLCVHWAVTRTATEWMVLPLDSGSATWLAMPSPTNACI